MYSSVVMCVCVLLLKCCDVCVCVCGNSCVVMCECVCVFVSVQVSKETGRYIYVLSKIDC